MYHWIAAIAPRRATGFLSFVTGWCTVAGCKYAFLRILSILIISRDFHYCFDKSDLCAKFHGIDCLVPWKSGSEDLDDFHRISSIEPYYSRRGHVCQLCYSSTKQILA